MQTKYRAPAGDNLFLAGDQGRRRPALLGYDAVVDLTRQQPQGQSDRPGAVAEHALDREMGLAGIGGAEDGGDAAGFHGGRSLAQRRIAFGGAYLPVLPAPFLRLLGPCPLGPGLASRGSFRLRRLRRLVRCGFRFPGAQIGLHRFRAWRSVGPRHPIGHGISSLRNVRKRMIS